MRIVDRKTFLALPTGTIYAKYQPCVFGELQIKDRTVGDNSWIYDDTLPWPEAATNSGELFDLYDRMQAGEASGPLDFNGGGRDSDYDDDQLFGVFERQDVEGLILRLQEALETGYPKQVAETAA